MSGWEAVIAGIIGAGAAYTSSRAAKKQQEGAHDEWERRMEYERDKVARKRDSMGGRMAPYIMEQMMKVYGQQSAGRGGFTLPIEEMMQNMNLKGRQDGTYAPGSNGRPTGGSFRSGGSSDGGEERDLGTMLSNQMYGSDGKRYLKGMDPEIAGYNGKTWEGRRGSAALEGAPSSGGSFGTSAFEVGGHREATRTNDGGATRVNMRGVNDSYKNANGSSMTLTQGDTQGWQGDLATGGTVTGRGMDLDTQKIMKIAAAVGIGSGPKGAPLNPDGTYGDGRFQASDIADWMQHHPILSAIFKSGANLVFPGAGNALGASANQARKVSQNRRKNSPEAWPYGMPGS